MPRGRYGGYLVAALVLLLDQLTKLWIEKSLPLHTQRELLPFFNLVHTRNPGAAFSFLAQAGGWQVVFFVLLALAMALLLAFWLWRLPEERRLEQLGLGLILGGALGNMVDRLRHRAVVDFLDFHIGSWHWPAFNLADSAITLGVLLLLFNQYRDRN